MFGSPKPRLSYEQLLLRGGLLFTLVGVALFVRATYIRERSIPTPAIVVEMVERAGSSNTPGTRLYAPIFEYTDGDGDSHRVEYAAASNPPGYGVGQSVTLWVDPDDPRVFRVEGGLDFWLLPLGALGFGVLILLGAFSAYRELARENKARSD